tara:strand:+ start:807 stop:1082 length:276 start_codon:yes stop_codon:yes gene_type:complete
VADFPFKEEQISKKLFLREFKHDVVSEELIWHQDREDRIIEVVSGVEWYLQIDNQLPVLLEANRQYQIPKMTYHRLIKGRNNLVIRLWKDL